MAVKKQQKGKKIGAFVVQTISHIQLSQKLLFVCDGFECEKEGSPLSNDDRRQFGGLFDVFDIKTKDF
jgi:hypothetical protein